MIQAVLLPESFGRQIQQEFQMLVERLITLYKTALPAVHVEPEEYYALSVCQEDGRFFLKEEHGWWDESRRKSVNPNITLCPEDGYGSEQEALSLYDGQKEHRFQEGFVHCRSRDLMADE